MEKIINQVEKKRVQWNLFEKLFIVIAPVVILVISIYWKDTFIGIISSITGVLCVILTAKGLRICYIPGLVNVLLYSWISYNNRFFGEVMLNMLYYLPMQFIGWYMWSKSMKESGEVEAKRMNNKNRLITLLCTAILIIGYGFVLMFIGGNLPFIDSTSTVLSVIALFLSVKKYMEQWVLFIVVNVVSIVMWAIALSQGSTDIATLLMWSVYLINAVYGLIKWNKESKENKNV